MNQTQCNELCSYFQLGTLLSAPQPVHGGLLHKMWQIETEKGIYAVKALSSHINLNDVRVVANYELTERIASTFIEKGIPAVCAMMKSGKTLVISEDQGFLVYPWVDARALDLDRVSHQHALKMSELLANMHRMDLKFPDLDAPHFDLYSREDIIAAANKAAKHHCAFRENLQSGLQAIIECNEGYLQAMTLLQKQVVVGHGDLDQKNVLWDTSNQPILIDWESARLLNPTYEIVNASFDWSGITSQFDEALFNNMLKAYQKAGGALDEQLLRAAIYGVLGNWINWLMYNLERSCQQEPLDQKLGVEQVTMVLPMLLRIQALVHKLSKK